MIAKSHRSPRVVAPPCASIVVGVLLGVALLLLPTAVDSFVSRLPPPPPPSASIFFNVAPPNPTSTTTITTTSPMSSSRSSSRSSDFDFVYTHLEGNGQIWQITHRPSDVRRRRRRRPPVDYDDEDEDDDDDGGGGRGGMGGGTAASSLSIVVDPLAYQLDFGVPWGYRANKRVVSERDTLDAICDARPSHCLLTMGLDDHAHARTLSELCRRLPGLKFVVAPSCVDKLSTITNDDDGGGGGGGLPRDDVDPDRVTVLEHDRTHDISSDDGDGDVDVVATITATRGALVGPPWQRRENGYLMELSSRDDDDDDGRRLGIYYEPHGDAVLDDVRMLRANIVISPVIEQSLPAQLPPWARYTLVHGGERTLRIAEALRADVILPLGNGELDIEGPLSGLVASSGSVDEFEMLVKRRNMERASFDDRRIEVMRTMPGVPLTVMI
ncbi:hypothetical protein ACHAXA_003749 [Cyclostephanos tholiformis]|uniref:Uncharacterized protein n=1 Tax=Cyclostephanos tholiformis TaxID=382380 RepID=A0ABD3SS90_9STRA